MRLRVVVYFTWWCVNWMIALEKTSTRCFTGPEEQTGTMFWGCLRNCTNSNPTFVGVLSLNLENHLLPTFQKCLCIFYTLRLINERPILWFQPFASFKNNKKKQRTTRNKPPQTAVPQKWIFLPSKWMLSRTCVTGIS